MRIAWLGLLAIVAGCAGGPAKPDWEMSARDALQSFQRHYFAGDTRLADAEFRRARAELARTGRGDLLARAELLRCAVRTASLEFDDCPGFEALRDVAGKEELAYAEYLAGRAPRRASADDALSRLVRAGIRLRFGAITPAEISGAVEAASAQGWRRALLAWLGVQAKRAEDAGDTETAARLRRRIGLIAG